MEEKIKLQLQLASSMEDGFREEEFYEQIEAPKFVDFTLPDHYSPDDRYWFCSRVGVFSFSFSSTFFCFFLFLECINLRIHWD